MNAGHVRRFVVRPTLVQLGLWSTAAELLLLGTAAAESGLEHLDQITPGSDRLGPAYGIYQIEPATHRDLFANMLIGERWPALRRRVLDLRAHRPTADEQLVTNLAYATVIARLI